MSLLPYSFFDDVFLGNMPLARRSSSNFRNMDTVRMDMAENENNYIVKADLPGFNKDNIHISFNNGMLNVSAEQTDSRVENNERYHMSERMHGSYSRTINLPGNINPSGMAAKYENGVLHVNIPKSSASPGRRINIE
jgi:HSP20 family protein